MSFIVYQIHYTVNQLYLYSGWDGRNCDIFRNGNSQGLHILLKEVACMMTICHIQMNRDKINSQGESTGSVNGKSNMRRPPSALPKTFRLLPLPTTVPAAECHMNQRSQVTAGLHWIKRKIHLDTCYRCILHFSPPIHLHLSLGIEEKFKFGPNRVDNHNQAGFGWKNEWRLRQWGSKTRSDWKMLLAWC